MRRYGDQSVIKKICRFIGVNYKWRIVIAVVVLVIAVSIRCCAAGISFFDKRAKIDIKNQHYHMGISAWNELDYLRAKENLTTALEELTREKGKNSLETAEASHKLGALYLEMGRYEEAYELLNSAYVVFRDKLGDDDSNTVTAKCQIALYDICTGNTERANATFNEVYDETKYIANKFSIAQMIAQCYMKNGDYSMAVLWYDYLGQLYNETGIRNLALVNMCNDYCLLLFETGQYDTAIDGFLSTISIWESLNIKEDDTIANIYANLAVVYLYGGRFEEGTAACEKSMEIWKSLYGDENVNCARVYLNIAEAYENKSMFDNSKQSLDRALEIALSVVGENHELTASIYNDFGIYYSGRGMFQSAIEYHTKAIEIRKNILGKEHISTAAMYMNLSECYCNMGMYDKSIDSGTEAIRIYEDIFGKNSVQTARAYTSITWTYNNLDNVEEAMRYITLALDTYNDYGNGHSLDIAYAYQTAGYTYANDNRYDEAKDYLERSLVMFVELSGENTINAAQTNRYLGVVYALENNPFIASEYYKKSLAVLKELSLEGTVYQGNSIYFLSAKSTESKMLGSREALNIILFLLVRPVLALLSSESAVFLKIFIFNGELSFLALAASSRKITSRHQ